MSNSNEIPLIDDQLLLNECKEMVKNYFNGDLVKTDLWFWTKNPLLGELTPNYMIQIGRVKRLHQFIKTTISENYRNE